MTRIKNRFARRVASMLSLSLLAGFVTVVAQPVIAPTPVSAAPITFAYTGTPQLYIVPDGVTSVDVTLKGAGNGTLDGDEVTATINTLVGGTTLQVNVGGAGPNGWNNADSSGPVAGAGGASDIRLNVTSATATSSCAFELSCGIGDRLVVAAGGNGGGGASTGSGSTVTNFNVTSVASNAGAGEVTITPQGSPATAPTATVFTYTGAPQVYQVPSDISLVSVRLFGGAGGAPAGTPGAEGDVVWGLLSVPSGGFIQVNVGGQGTATGGWNGGGDGFGAGFGGGGATDLSMCSTASLGGCNVTDRRIIAAGGGGSTTTAPGSDGGSIAGGAAADPTASGSGGGGTLVGGGVGAAGTPAGENGGQGYGGNARSGTDSGGGGAGLYGGGGGVDGPGGGGSSCASVAGSCDASNNELTKTNREFHHAGGGSTGNGFVVIVPVPTSRTALDKSTPAVTANPTSIVAASAVVHGAVNPNHLAAVPVAYHGANANDVAVPGTGTRTALSPAGPLSGTGYADVSGTISGLSPATTYHYRICAESAAGVACGSTQTFSTMIGPATPAVDDPTVDPATITDTTADFTSQVFNPGTGPTSVVIECSADSFSTTITGTASPATVTGVSPISITGQCTGLTAGVTYEARVAATNTVGTGWSSIPTTFTTMSVPAVVSFGLTTGSVASSYAAFTGSVNPGSGSSSAPTSVEVECSTDPTFPNSITAPTVAGSAAPSTVTGTSAVPVTGSCMGLDDFEDYYARLVVTNDAGSDTSANVTFTTTAIVLAPTVSDPTIAAGPFGTSVDLTGTIPNPGHGPTNVYFECSKASDSFAPGTTQLVQANPATATGLSSVTVTGSCINLAPGTAYLARIKAVNTAAPTGVVSGTPLPFTTTAVATAPVVSAPALVLDTNSDPLLAETSATIEATVTDPGLGPTTVVFELSTSPTFPSGGTSTATAYTTLSPLTPAGTLAGNSAVSITTELTGLTPGTGYYVRVKATNPSAVSGVTSVPAFFTTYTYAITPTLGTLTVQNGSVTASGAGFSGAVTNPGSSVNLVGTSQVSVVLECSLDSFSTIVTGTVTSGPFSGRTQQGVTGSCTNLAGATQYEARLAVTATPTDPTDTHYSAPGGVPQPYTVYSNIVTFTTLVTQTQPVVDDPSVGTPTTSSADITVDVTDPGGGPTTVLVECATTQAFAAGTIVFTAVGANSPVSGNSLVTVTATCASLSPNTQYWVRVKATNSAGTGESDWQTTPVDFTTAPSIGNPVVTNAVLASVTAPAVNPAYTSIKLTGTLTDPAGAATDVFFECSTDAAFTTPMQFPAYLASNSTAATGQTNTNVAVIGECTGLTDGTTYYVRLKASNSNGDGYSPSQLIEATPAYVHSPVLGQITVVSKAVNPVGLPYTTTKAAFAAEITDPGNGPTSIAFECATDAGFTQNLVAGTSIVGSPVSGRSPATVTGECIGLLPDEDYYVRITGTSTPTDPTDSGHSVDVNGVPQPHTVTGTTLTLDVVAFTTVPIVVAPSFGAVTPPTPPAGTPTVPTITTITAVGSNPGTTQVAGTLQASTSVAVTVNGIDRTAGSTPSGTDACTVTGSTYVCILDPQVAPGATVRITSTNPAVTPALSSHTDAVVPASGSTPVAPVAEVLLVTPQLPEKVTLKALVDPGVGPTAVVFVYSTKPDFGTASYLSVASADLHECSTGPMSMTGSGAASFQQTCLGLPDANETYWVRAKATNNPTDGTTSPVTVWSNAMMFTTIERTGPPDLPLGVSVVTATDTTLALSAIVDPGNLPTTVTFECATDALFSNIVDTVVAAQSPVSGKTVKPATAICTGLAIATTYYLRVTAVNALGNAAADTTGSTAAIPTVTAGGTAGSAGGGGGSAPSHVLGSLGPFPPKPFLLPGKNTVLEDGVVVPGRYSTTGDTATVAGDDYSVTFRGLTADREVLAISAAPEQAVIVGCRGFVQVSGSGFMASSIGKLHVYGAGELLDTVAVNNAGSFSLTVRMPDDMTNEQYDLQLNAYSKSLKVRSVTVGVRLGECPPPPPVTVVGKKTIKTIQQVYFDPYSYELDRKSKKALRKLVRLTTRQPVKVKSIGYVQGQGTPLRGRVLSQQRADIVLDFLVSHTKMEPKKAVAKGKNVDGNFGPDRTVQVIVIWKKPTFKTVPAVSTKTPHGAVAASERTSGVAVATPARHSAATVLKAAKQALRAAKAERKQAKAQRDAAIAALTDGKATKADKRALKTAKQELRAAKRAVKTAKADKRAARQAVGKQTTTTSGRDTAGSK